MVKLVILFAPAAPSPFEGAYNTFLALAEAMPDVARRQVAIITGAPTGEAPYTRALELYFADRAALDRALQSDAGQRAGRGLGAFAQLGAPPVVYFAEVYEDVTPIDSGAPPPDAHA